jgi:hypothetical protein
MNGLSCGLHQGFDFVMLKANEKNPAKTAGFFPPPSISAARLCPVATMPISKFLFQSREESAIGTIPVVANSKSD